MGTLVFFVVIVAPIIAGVPLVLSGGRVGEPLAGGELSRWLGALLLVAGVPLWVEAAVRFVQHGRGTPAPVAPPVRLVVQGSYRWVRNPLYIAVVAMVVGLALLLGNGSTLIYGVVLALGFHAFVVLYEEPTLRSRFGEEYLAYCHRVPRWIPRWRTLHRAPTR